MKSAILILVPLVCIYRFVRSDTSASKTPFDMVFKAMSAILDRLDEKITEHEKDVADLTRPKPEVMAFSKIGDSELKRMKFDPDQSMLSIPDDLKFTINEEERTFQAPVSGIYHFTYTILSHDKHSARIERDNNFLNALCHIFILKDRTEMIPFSVTAYLKANESFWIKCPYGGRCLKYNENSIFSGFLVDAQ